MKLKNKKTGEILETARSSAVVRDKFRIFDENTNRYYTYDSLAELNEEWEDYEKSEGYWYIDFSGKICYSEIQDEISEKIKLIGNYYDSYEEAEKVVEKLKAWKRLKDKGFRFTLTPGVGSLDITPGKFQIEINADMPEKWFCCDAVQKDLDDCFGGEE